jgi:hypothetical protein
LGARALRMLAEHVEKLIEDDLEARKAAAAARKR